MQVALFSTFQPWRAHMAAGLLREYGIAAWVLGDLASSGYGPMTTGACRVMVNDEDAAGAKEILDAQPEPEEPAEGGCPPVPRRWSFPRTVAAGMVHGLIWVPLLQVAGWLLLSALAALGIRPDVGFGVRLSPASLTQAGIGGLILGFACGVAAWFIGDYKRSGSAGKIFITLLVIVIILVIGSAFF